METVGSFEAKTHLAELLERVAAGESITITKHGKAVAMLVPVRTGRRDAQKAAAHIRELRKGNRLGGISIRELIEMGRR
jgi:prevent-host-death family protein